MWKQNRDCQHWHRLAVFLLCIASTGYFAGCHQPTPHDLIGKWEVNYEDSKLKLTLNPDGTFEQAIEQKGKNVIRRNGKWELTDLEGPCVLLNGALVMRDEKGTVEFHGAPDTPTKRDLAVKILHLPQPPSVSFRPAT